MKTLSITPESSPRADAFSARNSIKTEIAGYFLIGILTLYKYGFNSDYQQMTMFHNIREPYIDTSLTKVTSTLGIL